MNDPGPDIGVQIRARRRAQGLTLEALAEGSGVSTAMLSEVERSVKNPTVRLAWQVARALGCSLTELLDEPGEATRLVRSRDRRTLVDPETGVVRHGVSTALMNGMLEVANYVLPGNASSGEMPPNRAGVVEHVVMLRGRMAIVIGDEQIELEGGDHITYRPQVPVEYRNAADDDSEFLLLSDSSGVVR